MERAAHEEALAGARAARARNTGSLTLVDAPEGERRPPSAPGAGRTAEPRESGPPVGGYQHYTSAEQRPGSAASMHASDESAAARERFRAKNQSSFTFG